MTSEEIKSKWSAMINKMLETYREENPNDTQTDEQVIHNFLEKFVEKGIIKKENGKYILYDGDSDETQDWVLCHV